MVIQDSSEWNKFLVNWPEAHLLQTSAWGELKSAFSWDPIHITAGDCGAQVLFRRLPLGFSLAYIPKGPVGKNFSILWPAIHAICKRKNAVFLRVEPDVEDDVSDSLAEDMQGFLQIEDTFQPRQTVLVDISGSPEIWLSNMKQKTRYNTRLAEKKGVRVVKSQNFSMFETLMRQTGARDGFGVHTLDYYKKAYEIFDSGNKVALLEAQFESQILAMVMVFYSGKRAYYLYGASGDAERQRMPAYLLQFEAMRWAAEQGCILYDMWGIPDVLLDTLEESFESRSDGLWGVYRFKRGYGGRIARSAPGFDFVYQPIIYKLLRWQMTRGRGMGG